VERKNIVIIGAGGFGRELLDILDACNAAGQDYGVLGYVVDSQYSLPGTVVNSKPVLGGFDWLSEHASEVYAVCGVGLPQLRLRLVERAQERGVRFCSVIHPAAIVTRWVTIGEGVVIAAGCIVTNGIRIGNHVHINLSCTIGHDAVLEDFVTLAPGVHVSGNVTLSAGCYVGTGANIIDKMRVGEWSTVGAGSTIFKDVSPNSTVVGVPGRTIVTRETGWHLRSTNHEG
jgi:sugar O-acyltransferase (sialic acid O-acetyltransferase NeuD family)